MNIKTRGWDKTNFESKLVELGLLSQSLNFKTIYNLGALVRLSPLNKPTNPNGPGPNFKKE